MIIIGPISSTNECGLFLLHETPKNRYLSHEKCVNTFKFFNTLKLN
jgi:hypothetical protein